MSKSFVTPWTAAHQAPPSMGFSRQEHWVGWHFLLQIWLLRPCVYIVHKVNWLCNLIPCHILLVPSILSSSGFFFFFFFMVLFVFGCAGSLLLHGFCSSCDEQRLLSGCSVPASPCGVFSCYRPWALGPKASVAAVPGSRAQAHGLGCSTAGGTSSDQGSHLRLLRWQADSLPLNYQGSPLSSSSFLLISFPIADSVFGSFYHEYVLLVMISFFSSFR